MGSRQKRRYADLSKPRTHWDLSVEMPQAGLRLDQFLAQRVRWRSRSQLQALIDEGSVSVNGDQRKASTRMADGDQVVIIIPEPQAHVEPGEIPIEVIFESEELLAINKQPGIVVHPTSGHTLNNVLSALHARYRRPDDPDRDLVPHICHRLDQETSGVLLFAFCEKIKADIGMQFEHRTPRKEYLSLVHGCPREAEGTVDAPILHRRVGWPRLVVDEAGQSSQTSWRVEEDFGACALVRWFPRTGRTHQIRVHSAHLGHPLLCDETYGGTRPITRADVGMDGDAVLLERVALHSTRLEIRHPSTGEQVVFEAPLPEDLARVVEALRGAV